MVVDIVLQTEINKKENRLYPVRYRPYIPNIAARGITGKFYARHDFLDPSLMDSEFEKTILDRQTASLKDRYKEPPTVNSEYGWYPGEPVGYFFYPKKSSWITQIGAAIAMEDQKNPKKPFSGVAFKV